MACLIIACQTAMQFLYCTFIITLVVTSLVHAKIVVIAQDGEIVDTIFKRKSPYCNGPSTELEGVIVLAEPPDACTTVEEPTFHTNSTLFKFVLINGNESCSLVTKMQNVETAGFDLGVLYDQNTLLRFIPPIPRPLFGIPCVLISHDDWVKIQKYYTYKSKSLDNYILVIIPNYNLAFAVVIYVVFGFVLITMVVCMIFQLIKFLKGRYWNRQNRLPTRQIKKIATYKFAEGDNYSVCAICLEDYIEGDELRVLRCSHAYHACCVDPWLDNRKNCPVCNRKVTSSESDTDSELTSAENSRLINFSTNRSRTWGTFSEPATNQANSESNVEDLTQPRCSHRGQTTGHSYSQNATDNLYHFSNDNQSDYPPSSSYSVNCDEKQALLPGSDSDSSDHVCKLSHRQSAEPRGDSAADTKAARVV